MEWNTVHTAIKQVIKNHIDKMYYKNLRNRFTVYTNFSGIDIIFHTKTEHRELDKSDYAVNDARIKVSITGKTTFEELVEHIKYNMEVFSIQAPYTNQQVVQISVNIINIAGFYIKEAKKWDAKITAEKCELTLNSIIPHHSVKSEIFSSLPINHNT